MEHTLLMFRQLAQLAMALAQLAMALFSPGIVIHGGPCRLFTAGLDLKAAAWQMAGGCLCGWRISDVPIELPIESKGLKNY